MNQTERLYKIERLLRARRYVPMRDFIASLEVSRATLNRDLERLRDRHGAPIVYDRELRGYRLCDAGPGAPRHELPGLWFNSAELHALLAFHHFLEHVEPGLLKPYILPLKHRIESLLEKTDHSAEEIIRRIRVLPLANRRADPERFAPVAQAVLARRRLRIVHYSRARDEERTRTVSPQRLVHYRDNWYLDAWDHGKRALRTFSVDCIRRVEILTQSAKDVADAKLDAYFASAYGIFAGKAKHKAILRFTPERARWVADEQWHPEQRCWRENGDYFLEIPYSDPRELIMDILKYGPDVEVLGPQPLRRAVRDCLESTQRLYHKI